MVTRGSVRRGFTLIELLVVIAIIAILAAILFPVFASARDKARQSRCIANVKQLAMAVEMYVDDYDEFFPMVGYLVSEKGSPCFFGLDRIIYPYTKNAQIWHCP